MTELNPDKFLDFDYKNYKKASLTNINTKSKMSFYRDKVSDFMENFSHSTVTLGDNSTWDGDLGLTRSQRFLLFVLFFSSGFVFFIIALMRIPLIIMRPWKFSSALTAAFSMWLLSLGWLVGWRSYYKRLTSKSRRVIFSTAVGCCVMSNVLLPKLNFYPLSVSLAILESLCVFSLIISFMPGGTMAVKGVFNVIFAGLKCKFFGG